MLRQKKQYAKLVYLCVFFSRSSYDLFLLEMELNLRYVSAPKNALSSGFVFPRISSAFFRIVILFTTYWMTYRMIKCERRNVNIENLRNKKWYDNDLFIHFLCFRASTHVDMAGHHVSYIMKFFRIPNNAIITVSQCPYMRKYPNCEKYMSCWNRVWSLLGRHFPC